LFCFAGCREQKQHVDQNTPADKIFYNGKIFTSRSEDDFVTAMVIKDEEIVATGDDTTIVHTFGAGAALTDLQGRLVLPGFHDAHLHFWNGAKIRQQLDLRNTPSLKRTLEKIMARVSRTKKGDWIIGRGWDHELWEKKNLPDKKLLDQISTDHFIYLKRVDGHAAWVNSPVLDLLGYGDTTPDPFGGRIMHYPDSKEPNGILFDAAYDTLDKMIPKPNPDQQYEWIRSSIAFANEVGITSITDNSDTDIYHTYTRLFQNGELNLRVNFWMIYNQDLDSLMNYVKSNGIVPHYLKGDLIKLYADGSLGSRSAYLLKPYDDDPSNVGLPQYPSEKLYTMTKHIVESNLFVGIHAIGDAAVKEVLNAYERVAKMDPSRDYRFRIEHAQMIDPQDIDRFKQLNAIASMQPSHCITDLHWAERRIGKRARYAYTWKTFLDRGIALAFGTDWPVEPLNPMIGLYAAITRKDTTGYPAGGWYPQERISLAQAIIAYTYGSAYAARNEDWCGTLEPGKVADFVILDRNIFNVAPKEILKTKVLSTYLGGKEVYSRVTP
jgi:predicted amidohydrolase YtcJ